MHAYMYVGTYVSHVSMRGCMHTQRHVCAELSFTYDENLRSTSFEDRTP